MSDPTDSFPRSLLSLTDAELSTLMARRNRCRLPTGPPFETVAARLQRLPAIGPGSLHVLLREVQAEFLRTKSPFEDGGAKPMSAQNSRPWTRGPGRPRKT